MTVTEKQQSTNYAVTYEAEVAGGWFADLRDSDGRRVETGLGRTQQAALAHALARIEEQGVVAAAFDAGMAVAEKLNSEAIAAVGRQRYAEGYAAREAEIRESAHGSACPGDAPEAAGNAPDARVWPDDWSDRSDSAATPK